MHPQSCYFQWFGLVALSWQFILKFYQTVMTLGTEFRGFLLPIFGDASTKLLFSMIWTCSFELAIYIEVLSNCDDFRYWISGIFITDFRGCIQSRYFELLWLVALKCQFTSKLYPTVMTDFGFTLDTEFRGILLPIFGVSFKGQFSEASSRRFQVSTRIENCQLCIFQKKNFREISGNF